MKKLIVLTFCGVMIYAMDYEEQPHPEHQLQAIIRNKNTTIEDFKTYLEARPKLAEVTVTGHKMTHIPPFNIPFDGLQILDLSYGTLACNKTLHFILAMAPHLHSCKLANNQIPALWSQEPASRLLVHHALTDLDCSNNQLTDVDFVELRAALPKLANLNLSGCPIHTFNTKDLSPNYMYVMTTIDLRNTQLPDLEKKEILKNAQRVDIADGSEGGDGRCFAITGMTLAGACAVSFFPLLFTIPLSTASTWVIPVAVCADFAGSAIVGLGSAYLIFLGSRSPKDRFQEVYKPLLDNAGGYSEEEVTTRYGRFVKYFPYFCALSKCCHAEDPEYMPLNQIEEQ